MKAYILFVWGLGANPYRMGPSKGTQSSLIQSLREEHARHICTPTSCRIQLHWGIRFKYLITQVGLAQRIEIKASMKM